MIYYLRISYTKSVAKQLEIMALILLRNCFKDTGHLTEGHTTLLSSELIKDLSGFIVILILVWLFYHLDAKRGEVKYEMSNQFIKLKDRLAVFLMIVFFGLSIFSFSTWISDLVQFSANKTSLGDPSHIFYTGSSDEIFKITGEGDIRLSGKTQPYTIVGGGKSDTDLSFHSGNSSENSSINFFTKDGTTTENNDICIFGLGLPSQTSNSEYLRVGWDSTNNYYEIGAKHSGTGILRDFVLGNEHVVIQTSGSILFNAQTTVDNIFDIISTENSTGVSTGSLRVAGGVTIKKDLFLGSDFVLGSEVDYQMKMNTTLNNNFSTLTGSFCSSSRVLGMYLIVSF